MVRRDNALEDLAGRLHEVEQNVSDDAVEALVDKALTAGLRYFERRDLMNSTVHLDEVKWSPITDLLREAVDRRCD